MAVKGEKNEFGILVFFFIGRKKSTSNRDQDESKYETEKY